MSSYKIYHRPEPWTARRKTTDKIIVHARSAFTSALDIDTDFRIKGYLCCGYHYVLNGSGVSVMRHPETTSENVRFRHSPVGLISVEQTVFLTRCSSSHNQEALSLPVKSFQGDRSATIGRHVSGEIKYIGS